MKKAGISGLQLTGKRLELRSGDSDEHQVGDEKAHDAVSVITAAHARKGSQGVEEVGDQREFFLAQKKPERSGWA